MVWLPLSAACWETCQHCWKWAKTLSNGVWTTFSLPLYQSWADNNWELGDKVIPSSPIPLRAVSALFLIICLAHVYPKRLANLWKQPLNRTWLNKSLLKAGSCPTLSTRPFISTWEHRLCFDWCKTLSEGGKPEAWGGWSMERAMSCAGFTLVSEIIVE